MDFNPSPGQMLRVRKRRPARPDPTTFEDPLAEAQQPEFLPRTVQGKRATDIEARMSIALQNDPEVTSFEFKVIYLAGRFLPGRLEVDYAIYTASTMYPVFLDGLYWHRTPDQRAVDQRKVDEINAELAGSGAFLAQRVPGDPFCESVQACAETIKLIFQGYFLQNRGVA